MNRAGAGAILAAYRAGHSAGCGAGGGGAIPWQLRWLPVCASTEAELDRWLRRQPPQGGEGAPLRRPRLVIAGHQRFGHGQRGRSWQSPPGGLWLSAALPWPADPARAASPALAVAVALAEQLAARGVPVGLKWPNDLLLLTPSGPRKLAGLLPGLRRRGGAVRWARIGVGLNGRNPVPAGAADLRRHPRVRAERGDRLAALALAALARALALAAEPEQVVARAEALLSMPATPIVLDGAWWWPEGLSADGGLRLVDGSGRRRLLQRF